MGESVIQCDPNFNEIKKAILKAISIDFKNRVLLKSINPYGTGNSSDLIVKH